MVLFINCSTFFNEIMTQNTSIIHKNSEQYFGFFFIEFDECLSVLVHFPITVLTYQTDEPWIIIYYFKYFGTTSAHKRFKLKTSFRIASTEFIDMPTSSASPFMVKWWFPITLFLIFPISPYVVDIDGRPKRCSSSTDSRPFLNSLCHWNAVFPHRYWS